MIQRLRPVGLAVKTLTSRLMVALLIVALFGFLGLFLWQSLQIRNMQEEYAKKKAEVAAVQERTDRLQEHLDFYKGPGYLLYVEKVAREALGLVKPGETVVLTVPDNAQSATQVVTSPGSPATATAPPAESKKKPNWQNWFDFFAK